jgi:LDH2 family malate/lactate/ureidoglycolate dehydrogenase
MDSLSEQCRENLPVSADRPVRVPGDQAARSIAAAHSMGISYDSAAWTALGEWARELGVPLPAVD